MALSITFDTYIEDTKIQDRRRGQLHGSGKTNLVKTGYK